MSYADLNAALTAAMKRGGRPFRCWHCKVWFVDTGKGHGGRPRVVCESKECQKARQRYMAFGVLPGEPYHQSKEHQEKSVLTRCILRALEADWLSDREIAEEFGCETHFVGDLRRKVGMRPRASWRAA